MFQKRTKWLCAAERFLSVNEIGDKLPEGSEHDALCMLARRSVKLPKRIETATLRISADDAYVLYLNGQFVSRGPASCYPREQYVQQLDVAKYLKAGQNLIALSVHYDGKLSPARYSGDNRQGFILELEVNGSLCLSSNDRFRCLCPTGASFLREDGHTVEVLDQRSYPLDWMQPKYDDSAWVKPVVRKNTDYDFVPQPVKDDLYVEFNALPGENGVYDLEDDYTGVLLVSAHGPDGAQISFHAADENGEQGKLLCRLLLNGSAEAEFTLPRHLRRIKPVMDEDAVLDRLTVRVFRHNEDENALSLKTVSSELIDALKRWKNALMDDADAAFDAQETFVDEGIRALAKTYLSGEIGHLSMYLKNMALSRTRVKTLLSGVPCSLMKEDRVSSLLFVHHAYLFSLHCDDSELLSDLRDAAGGVIRAFATYARKDGLLENADKECSCCLNAVYIGALFAYEKICKKLDVDSGVHPEAAKKLFNETFLDDEKGVYGDAPEDNIYPLYFGLLPPEVKSGALEMLKRPGARRDEYYRLKALCRLGGAEDAYKQLIEGETEAPEAEICAFVEEILFINPKVIGGDAWKNHLPTEVGNVSVRVKAFGHRALFSRQDGFVTLKI